MAETILENDVGNVSNFAFFLCKQHSLKACLFKCVNCDCFTMIVKTPLYCLGMNLFILRLVISTM